VEPNGILAAMYTPSDAYFEPSQVAIGFARAAQAVGASLQPDTEVTRVRIESGRVRGVETSRGPIDAPVVVDAAGAWARQIAASAGIHVPIVPTRHQLLITEPIEGVRPELPIIRIMDAAVYIRPCEGGLLVGGYEEHPLQFSTESLPVDVEGTPLEIAVLSEMVDKIGEQLPALRGLRIREHRGGIPTMTPDGQHIVGSIPGVAGMFVATGCNVAGLSISPAIGELLAEWIIRGAPSVDLTPMSIARFDARWHSEHQLRSAAAWQYSHFYTYESNEPIQ
jgi:4-methylaminobutanoate oxidase (formaldehyde-forming)